MFTMILAFWGSLLLSLLVVCLSNIFELNDKEKLALAQLKLNRHAAGTIITALRHFVAKKKSSILEFQSQPGKESLFLKRLMRTKQAAQSRYRHPSIKNADTQHEGGALIFGDGARPSQDTVDKANKYCNDTKD